MRPVLFFASVFIVGQAAWVGENYWTTIYDHGQVEVGRSPEDFLHFKVIKSDLDVEAFIGFWIQKGPNGQHHESFGHVSLQGDQICGRFLSKDHNKTEKVCGGFRVLSRELRDYTSPFYFISSRTAQSYDSVGYRRMQVARIWVDDAHTSSVFGGVSLSERRAYGIFQNGTTINISYKESPTDYVNRVYVLHMERSAMEKVKETRKRRKLESKRKQHHHTRKHKRRHLHSYTRKLH
ncbi:hypothetical protein M3Y97_00974800 [Aphelenchoides bicaudatus]|nr:hypothetical protein M3Y97_00974800 [Aphelenchoides bicaudatus]